MRTPREAALEVIIDCMRAHYLRTPTPDRFLMCTAKRIIYLLHAALRRGPVLSQRRIGSGGNARVYPRV